MFQVLRLLFQSGRGIAFATATIAIASGIFNAGLIAVAHQTLSKEGQVAGLVILAFIFLGLGKIITGYYAEVLLTRFTQESIAKLRIRLLRKILAIPYRQFERLGSSKTLSILVDDVSSVHQAMMNAPALMVNIAVLGGGAAYLCWISWTTFLGMGFVGGLAALFYRSLSKKAFFYIRAARSEGDRLFNHLRSFTQGMKELKLNRRRRDDFMRKCVERSTKKYIHNNLEANRKFIMAHSASHACFFVLIGLVLFGLPRWGNVSFDVIQGYALTSLYLMGPVAGTMKILPMFSRARVSLERVEDVGLQLDQAGAEKSQPLPPELQDWKTIRFENIRYRYEQPDEDYAFEMGPIDLEIPRGQLLFLTGGNGSGKSTLGKIITGLYHPDAGKIRVDGVNINDQNRDSYRQLFGSVFSDYHLFDRLLGISNVNLDARAQAYLKELQLDHKVEISDGNLSTTELSQGQRKRLALLTAYLEDRPLYLFDEWASDQDPQFKEAFYYQILPELRARGKTVIVVSHDDRYFDCADRFIKMENGQIQLAQQRSAS